MSEIFPQPIARLPLADIPVKGLTAHLSQGTDHQILFMRFTEEVELPEHAHESQVGFVLEGRIDLTIGGVTTSFGRGDRYFIPAGVRHAARIFAGYSDITFFDEKERYRTK